MLASIYIKNFAIIDEKHIPFSAGFNVLSGETGAGKSILIDALGLQLGDRSDSSWIRYGSSRCDIQSEFILPPNSSIHTWLDEHEYNDEENTCQLRRTLSSNGKSKCYINGIPTTLGNTKTLAENLVDIHGQHAHQSLTAPEKQLTLLDSFANHHELINTVKNTYQIWQKLVKQKEILQNGDNNLEDRYDLIHYQLQELTESQIADNEFNQLSERQKTLAANNEIIQHTQTIQSALTEEGSITAQLSQLHSIAEKITFLDENFSECCELINQSMIYIDEAASSINSYSSSLDLDPQALHDVETRMTELHDLARKHRVEPHELIKLQTNLHQRLEDIETALKQLQNIDSEIESAKKNYDKASEKLSNSRKKSAKKLADAIHLQLRELNLENARFRIEFTSGIAKANGIDNITFMFSPNPGQGEKPLHKIASGGELSRISLAIQVASVASKSDATLIFDEVDSGVGGATAEVIGRLLKTLSQFNQIICVTHLAQVAAFADNHLKISKTVVKNETFTDFHPLTGKSRIEELARMSGGIKMDKKTREHAQNLLDNAVQFSSTLTNN
ncbi:MAG: DNA repair protein RecN [Gammaproteobacteria bacterium]|nr:DNA repair protein RecN [Gammaproteobacteria bacterium]